MPPLTEYSSYADAQRHCSEQALWDLFDGDREALNITSECLDRHRGLGTAVRIASAEGQDESLSFASLSDWSNRFANYLTARGVAKGERV